MTALINALMTACKAFLAQVGAAVEDGEWAWAIREMAATKIQMAPACDGTFLKRESRCVTCCMQPS